MPCSTASRRKKPSSLYCVWRASDKSPLCVLFSGLQPAHLLCGMAVFKPAEISIHQGEDSRKKHRQSDSARFHWTWRGARARHAVECLCGGWHFNDLISLGRIFLWVVSSIAGSTKWSCCIMMNPLYLPLLSTCAEISAPDPMGNLMQSS